jgi:hypothetical protein
MLLREPNGIRQRGLKIDNRERIKPLPAEHQDQKVALVSRRPP